MLLKFVSADNFVIIKIEKNKVYYSNVKTGFTKYLPLEVLIRVNSGARGVKIFNEKLDSLGSEKEIKKFIIFEFENDLGFKYIGEVKDESKP